jgi:hypothetical protein
MDLQWNSKNPSQHEVVLASGSAAWNIIGCLRRQKLMLRIPSNGDSFVLLAHCNDQPCDHQLAAACLFLELQYNRLEIVPDLQSGFTIHGS